jgi:Condensation domain
MNEPQGTPNSPERSAENRPKLVKVSRDAPLPVSLAQQTILSYCKTSEDNARYVQSKIYQIIGPLDITALRDCLNYIVGRHEILRTTFGVVNGEPVQIVHPAKPILLSVFEAAPGGDLKKDAVSIIKEETSRTSDLTQGPLIRFSLLRIDEDKHWFFRICHHLLWDAWSTRLFHKELALLYEAWFEGRPPPLPEFEPLQYADHASWQRKILRRNGADYQEAIAWWKEHFQSHPARNELPWHRKILRRNGAVYQEAIAWWKEHFQRDRARLELPFRRQVPLLGLDPTDGTIDWPVDLELEQRLNWLSRTNGTTLFVVWLAALVALLAAETGQSDIIVGTNMTSRRSHPALRDMIGCFSNLVALRFHCDPATPFSEWLFEVRSSVTAAQERCEIPYKELRNALRGLGVPSPEMQVIFQAPMGTGRVDMQFGGLELCGLDLYTRSRMPWGFSIDLRKCHLQICQAYFDAGIYDPVAVRQFLGRLCEVLDAFAQHPDVSIGDLVGSGS